MYDSLSWDYRKSRQTATFTQRFRRLKYDNCLAIYAYVIFDANTDGLFIWTEVESFTLHEKNDLRAAPSPSAAYRNTYFILFSSFFVLIYLNIFANVFS